MPILHEIGTKRLVIYAKDVESITGRKGRTARKILKEIWEKLGEQKWEFITISEFCEYAGIKGDGVKYQMLYWPDKWYFSLG